MTHTTPRHALAFIVGILCALASAVVVSCVWRAGDAACKASERTEVISGYGYPITYSPCDDSGYEAWLEPAALR